MLVETDKYGAIERVIVQDSHENARLVGSNSVRGRGVLHQCMMAQRGVQ